MPHSVLFRGGKEKAIREQPLKNGHIDTGIPVCILVLKKCKKPDGVLFINTGEYYA